MPAAFFPDTQSTQRGRGSISPGDNSIIARTEAH